MRRGTLLAVVMTLLTLTGVESAVAGQIIYEKNATELWVANDDGTNQRPFIRAADIGATQVANPSIDPAGTTVVFQARTPRPGSEGSGNCGSHCVATYRWRDGKVARLSLPPGTNCQNNGQDCSTYEENPEISSAGIIYYEFLYCQAEYDLCAPRSQVTKNANTGGPGPLLLSEYCAELNARDDPYQVSPNPVNTAERAYGNCRTFGSNGGGNIFIRHTLAATLNSPSNPHKEIGCDDGPMEEPGWSADGTQIVDAERDGATGDGLWTYPSSGGACSANTQRYLLNPGAATVSEPRYIGSSTVIFAATGGGAGGIYTVPAACNSPSGTACHTMSSPQVTRVISDGSSPAWTGAATDFRIVADAPPANNGGGGGGGGGTTPGNTTPGGTTPSGPTTPTGPGGGPSFDLATALQSAGLSGKPTRKKGVTLLVNLAAPATVEFAFKKLGTVKRTGKAGKNSFRFTKVGKKKLKKGRYTVVVRVIGPDGKKGPARTMRFTIRK